MRNKTFPKLISTPLSISLLWVMPVSVAFPQTFPNLSNTRASQETVKGETVLKARGTIRDADSLSDGTLFFIEYEHRAINQRAVSTLIRQYDLTGRLVTSENTIYDATGKLKKYKLEQLQTNTTAFVEIVDQKVVMAWNENGSVKNSSDKASDNTVAAGSLMAYMSPHTKSLSQGESLQIRLAIPERGSVMSFSISPQRDDCSTVPNDLCVNLMLSNFILKKLLNPIKMSFQNTAQGYRPLSLVTPAVVRRLKGQNLEKFTARIDYPRL